MAGTTVSCTFDKDAVWKKVLGRKVIVLDMNCWINMADDKFPLAARVKDVLFRLVTDGLIICPLSFGLISELYKQGADSRLRVGGLMEELSLNVSYAAKEEIFAWEVERAVRRLVDAGPFDLSLSEIYVPVVAYLTSSYRLEYSAGVPPERVGEATQMAKEWLESRTFTEILQMRAARKGDDFFDYMRGLPPTQSPEELKRIWATRKDDKAKALGVEAHAVYRLYISPAIKKLPAPVQAKLSEHAMFAPKQEYGQLLKSLPALYNHVELMAARTQDPSRKEKSSDFFDLEVIPVPLAYATVFVAQDKGIRDVLRNRTAILKRTTCRYCFDLAELDEWLKTEVVA